MNKRIFGWDGEVLDEIARRTLREASCEFNHFLGDGSPLLVYSQVYFMRVQQLAIELAKTAGAISPSLRALSGIVAVSINIP